MIAILMSTYNGELFLRDQLDSLINQTVNDWQLFVRDDGSKDKTIDILREYEHQLPNKIHIITDIDHNIGAGLSFMHLLSLIDSDYYMFSDQDDVWMPTKMEKSLAKIKLLETEYGNEKPIGIFTDLTVVDSNLHIIQNSLWKYDNRHPEYTRNFYKQWTNRHASYGCTQMFNRASKNIVLPYKQFEGVMGAHDNWIEYILIKKGIYGYLDEPTILYRQHGTNAVGANFGHSYIEDIRGIITSPSLLFKKIKKDNKRMKLMPFYVSPWLVIWYRFYQSFLSIIRKL